MAKVPDLFEDLKNCYSENDEYTSAIEHLSLNQKSFYDTSYGPTHKNFTDEFVSLSATESSRMSNFTFKESLLMKASTSASRKVLKKRRLSFNQTMTDNALEALANGIEETIQPLSAPYIFQNNVRYRFMKTVKQEFVMSDSLKQNIYRDETVYLKAAPLQRPEQEVKFDMDAYSAGDDSKYPVTLRISNTQLYVSAQGGDQPVLIKEMPDRPRIITGTDTNLIFFWKTTGSNSTFESAAYPEMLLATKEQSLVHIAKGLPSMTDFQIS